MAGFSNKYLPTSSFLKPTPHPITSSNMKHQPMANPSPIISVDVLHDGPLKKPYFYVKTSVKFFNKMLTKKKFLRIINLYVTLENT